MLRADAISVRRGRRLVLREVSMQVDGGELVAVCGANGAGKSTLLAALTGELAVVAGAVQLDDRDLRRWDLAALARRRAVVEQHSPLSFPLSVLDVVLLGRLPHRATADTADGEALALEALARVGLEPLAARPYTALSGGERQRVHIARALTQLGALEAPAAQTRFLLLDEPTASLDAGHVETLLTGVRRWARQADVGVLVVVHDLNLAARFADRVLLLDGGALVADGTVHEVLRADLIERVFGIAVRVLEHPDAAVPLIVPRMATASA